MTDSERRRYPRVTDERVELTLATGSYDAVARTINISASGVYCKLDHEIPLMSRVKLALMIPDPQKAGKTRSIDAGGVVVREHPVIIDGKVKHYDVAIFFDDLTSKDRETIERHIAQRQV